MTIVYDTGFNSDLFKSSKSPAWQERRKLLIEVCGDVSDQDVIDLKHELKDLPALLGRNTLAEFRSIQDERRKKINEELKEIPTRILGEQHVREDCGRIPTLADWLGKIPGERWMVANVALDNPG